MATTTIKIKLLQPHTDAGVEYPAGAVITVDEPTAEWLVSNKIGEAAPAGK